MWIFILGVGIYFFVMMLVGFLTSRRINTMEDYLIAGRKLPFILVLVTLVSTWFGAGSCMGVSGTVYSQGFFGVIADPFGCTLAFLIGGIVFAAPFRRLRLLTISDLLRNSYGLVYERVSTLLVIPFYIGTLASQMLAMGYVFQIVMGGSLTTGILVGSAIVLFYTAFGGMWAVTVTDFVQFGLIVVGLCFIFFVSVDHVHDQKAVLGTFLNEFSTLTPKASSGLDWLSFAGRLLMTGLGAIMGQDLIQRYLSSKSEKVAVYSSVTAGFVYFLLGLIPLYIGIAGRDILPSLEKPEQLMPLLAKEFLSPIGFTIFACGLLSAIMSTADSYLLAGASLVTNNVLLRIWPAVSEQKKIRLLRVVNIGIAIMAIFLAMSGPSIFDLMVHSGATLFVGIFAPATFALFWKGANRISAWSSMIGGIGSWVGFILYYYKDLYTRHEDVLFSAAAFGGAVALVVYLGVAFVRKIDRRPQLIIQEQS